MCYHIAIPEWSVLDELLDNAIRNDEWEDYFQHLSGFAFAKIPVLTSESPGKICVFNWGLIPHWSRDEKQASELRMMTLNAKAETIFEKPAFRNSIETKRCLIFVEGFFEWRTVGKNKYPYFIYMKDQPAFALGGIYDSWVNKETGEIISTCSIITTPANELLSKIHNTKLRMPLIFTKDKMRKWIKPELSKEQLTDLMKPLPDDLLEAHTISKLITSRTENTNVAEVKEKFAYDGFLEF